MADEPLTEAEIAVLLGGRARSQPCAPTAPEQLLSLVTRVHEAASRHFGAELSAMLRRTARVRFSRLQSLSESDFCARAELPSFLRRFAVAPFRRSWILEIRPSALFPIIDCLLGGGREKTPIARRPLTEIESRLAARVARAWLFSLEAAWQTVTPASFGEQFEPCQSGQVSADEVLSVAFDIEVAGSQGSMHLAIPLLELGEICNLDGLGRSSAESADGVLIAAELSPVAVTAEDLESLELGDIITTDQRADEAIVVTQDGVPRFHAKLGAWQGHKAIEIQRELDAPLPEDEAPSRE
jgi:flagellar motor switch protein FliM